MTWAQTQTRQWLVLRVPRHPAFLRDISRDTVGHGWGYTCQATGVLLTHTGHAGRHAGGTAVTGATTSTACEKPGSKHCTSEPKHSLNTVLQHTQRGQYRTRALQQQGQKLASVSVRMNESHSENNDLHSTSKVLV